MMGEHVMGIQPAQVLPHARDMVKFPFPGDDAGGKVYEFLDGSQVFGGTIAVHRQTIPDVRENQGGNDGSQGA